MERKMYKVFGVVITLLLVFSMVAAFSTSTTPVAAGTQKWSQINLPTDVKGQVLPGSDVSTIAVTPDGKTLFAGVLNNSLWGLWKSTDGGYTWKQQSGYDALNASGDEIAAIKISPDWVNDGKIYVAANDGVDGYLFKSSDSGKTWPVGSEYIFPDATISSIDVSLAESGAVTVVVGTDTAVWLYDNEAWTNQNAGGAALAVAFSPDYATDGTIIAVVTGFGANFDTVLRAETDISANNWGKYQKDAYFSYKNGSVTESIPAVTACLAFPSDYATTQTVFVGLNSEDSGYTVGVSLSPGTDGTAPQHQTGDAFKVSLTSGVMSTSTVTDLNIRGTGTGTDVWSMAVSGDTGTAYIICGIRYASQSAGMENWQAQVHISINGGDGWSFSMKPPSGMTADINMSTTDSYVGLAAPVIVMAPDFDNSSTVYCANGYYSGNGGVGLSGFYVSTDKGAKWNGRGLLDRIIGAITDIAPSAQYDNDSTIYMVTQDTYTMNIGGSPMALTIGMLWKTVDGGAHWQIICDMVPLATVTSDFNALLVDKVVVAGNAVFLAGANGILGGDYDTIFRSTDAGEAFPTTIATRGPVDHLLAIDQDTLITANGSRVYKTTNGGATWTWSGKDTTTTSDILATENINDMVINGNTILVGTDQGNVYICNDYTTDFSFSQVGTKSVGNAATSGAVVVAFDTNYGTDKTIYAGVTGSNPGIWRNVDGADTWDQLAFNVSPSANYSAVNSNVSAIACDSNGILWAICTATNGSATMGTPIRSVNPTESTVSKVNFNSVTTGLTSTLGGNLNVVGSTNTLAVGGALNNELWIYTDTLVKVALVSPSNGASPAGDVLTGTSYAHVILTWTYMAKADSYQYQVALDPDFNNIVTDAFGVSVNGSITGTSLDVQLYAGTKYYWRVRVATGINSQWSDVWSFTTPLGPSAATLSLLGPTAGQESVSLLPVLQWSGLASATQYELQVAKNCDFSGSNLIVDKTGSNALGAVTAYQLTQSLTAGTNYCWRVRAKSDLSTSAWSNTASFTTAPTAAQAKEDKTPVWVWVVIALSAVLLVSVVILIIRTRRV